MTQQSNDGERRDAVSPTAARSTLLLRTPDFGVGQRLKLRVTPFKWAIISAPSFGLSRS